MTLKDHVFTMLRAYSPQNNLLKNPVFFALFTTFRPYIPTEMSHHFPL